MQETILDKMIRAAADTRGVILEKLTEFESLIDFYITIHFVGNDDEKLREFMSLIIAPNVNFRAKIEIFRNLVNTHNVEFGKTYKNYWPEFINIVDQRNILAHHPLNTSEEYIDLFKSEKIIGLSKFKGSNKEGTLSFYQATKFSAETTNDLLDKIYKYSSGIKKLLV